MKQDSEADSSIQTRHTDSQEHKEKDISGKVRHKRRDDDDDDNERETGRKT